MRFCAKKLRKTKISFNSQLSQKIFPVLRKLCKKIAQNRAKLIAFAKKNCAKIAQILRKRFSHNSWKPYFWIVFKVLFLNKDLIKFNKVKLEQNTVKCYCFILKTDSKLWTSIWLSPKYLLNNSLNIQKFGFQFSLEENGGVIFGTKTSYFPVANQNTRF